MRGLNSGCVDLIYLDPPFNSNKTYGAPVGSKAAGAIFKDMWTLDDIKDEEHGLLADKAPKAYKVIEAAYATGGRSMQAYLIFMAVRLLEMKRLMKPNSSIYLHCDQTAGHYLKLLLDAIFGKSNFLIEIVWSYNRFSRRGRQFAQMYDSIYAYSNGGSHTFNKPKIDPRNTKRYEIGYHVVSDRGETKLLVYDEKKASKKIQEAKLIGRPIRYTTARAPTMGNVWTDISIVNPMAKERTGYPTQKPLALIERIINASSNLNDLVFDPFCGCATTLVAAQRLTRDWIGCDVSDMAVTLVNERIRETQPLFKAINPDRNPSRTDTKDIPNYKNQGHLLYGQQEGICKGCNIHFPYGGMSIDHKHPQSKGGTDELDNLQMLCMRCNSSKGNKTMAEWNVARRKLL